MLWLAPGASVPAPPPDTIAKLPGFAPPGPMLLTVSGVLPLFVRVIVRAVLVVPTAWLAKLRLVGLKVTAGAGGARPLPTRRMSNPVVTPGFASSRM